MTVSVTTNAATDVTADSATLNGTLTDMGGNASLNVFFRYGETTVYGSETTPELVTETGAFSANISGLDPNTTYHAEAVAQEVI